MRRKEIKNLNGLYSADANELVVWLVKNVGPVRYSTYKFVIGESWTLSRAFDNYYAEFDARKVKPEQMTWFRLKWAK